MSMYNINSICIVIIIWGWLPAEERGVEPVVAEGEACAVVSVVAV